MRAWAGSPHALVPCRDSLVAGLGLCRCRCCCLGGNEVLGIRGLVSPHGSEAPLCPPGAAFLPPWLAGVPSLGTSPVLWQLLGPGDAARVRGAVLELGTGFKERVWDLGTLPRVGDNASHQEWWLQGVPWAKGQRLGPGDSVLGWSLGTSHGLAPSLVPNAPKTGTGTGLGGSTWSWDQPQTWGFWLNAGTTPGGWGHTGGWCPFWGHAGGHRWHLWGRLLWEGGGQGTRMGHVLLLWHQTIYHVHLLVPGRR